MFSANHFIVSQTSPHIVPFLNLKRRLGVAGAVAESEFRHRCARGGLCCMLAQGWGGRVRLERRAGEPPLKARRGTGACCVRSAAVSSSASLWEGWPALHACLAMVSSGTELLGLASHISTTLPPLPAQVPPAAGDAAALAAEPLAQDLHAAVGGTLPCACRLNMCRSSK